MSRFASLLVVLAPLLMAAASDAQDSGPWVDAEVQPLEGVARKSPDFWMGWKEDRVFVSRDGGRSWKKVGTFPEHPVRRIVFASDGRIFAEAGTGKVLVSETWYRGSEWEPIGEGTLYAYDFAVAAGRGADAPSPFDCLRESLPVRVKVTYGSSDCYFKTESTLYLKLGHEGAVLSGWSLGTTERVQVSPKALSRAEGERVLRELVGAATRQETPETCGSTQRHFAYIEWACSDAKQTEGASYFVTSHCGDGDMETAYLVEGPEYFRALGLRRAAVRALRSALR